AGIIVGRVNGFLHVAARLGENLAHLASHVPGVVLLALDENLGGAENNLSAARGGNQSPLGEGALGSGDGSVHVGLGGFLKYADQAASVGGIAIFEGLSGRGLDPLAVNEILENLGRAVAKCGGRGQSIGCHVCSLEMSQKLMLQPAGKVRQGRHFRTALLLASPRKRSCLRKSKPVVPHQGNVPN